MNIPSTYFLGQTISFTNLYKGFKVTLEFSNISGKTQGIFCADQCENPDRLTHVRHTSIQVLSHLHPNSNILISLPSMYCLTSIQVRSFMSHLHPCDISHLQPIHFHSSHDICITAPSMPYLTPICVSILAPELHPDHVSPPSKSHDLCLISIQVTPQPIPLHLSSS